MKDIQIERISIYGFTDDRGTDNYNLALSQNRANAIKKIFSRFGVDDNLISNVDGKGEVLLRVVSSDNLNIIRGLNRKVEINIEYPKNEEVKEEENKTTNLKKLKSRLYNSLRTKEINSKISRDEFIEELSRIYTRL